MTITDAVRERVRQQAKNRCGYCQIDDQFVYAPMEIDHIWPKLLGGTDEEDNLWLACPRCNGSKGAQTHAVDPETGQSVRVFNPRLQMWAEHFSWAEDRATIIGLTACGRASVYALQLNYVPNLELRRLFVQAGWYPPKDL